MGVEVVDMHNRWHKSGELLIFGVSKQGLAMLIEEQEYFNITNYFHLLLPARGHRNYFHSDTGQLGLPGLRFKRKVGVAAPMGGNRKIISVSRAHNHHHHHIIVAIEEGNSLCGRMESLEKVVAHPWLLVEINILHNNYVNKLLTSSQ